MRRKKFVELASAYLDGELTPEEEKLLKDELRDNPEHRALFAIYRRMNKAVGRARFPRPSAAPVRRAQISSTMTWGFSGMLAGVLISSAFILLRGTASPESVGGMELAAYESPQTIAVCSDDGLPLKHRNIVPDSVGKGGLSFAPTISSPASAPGRAGVSEILGTGIPSVAALHSTETASQAEFALDGDFSSVLVTYRPILSR